MLSFHRQNKVRKSKDKNTQLRKRVYATPKKVNEKRSCLDWVKINGVLVYSIMGGQQFMERLEVQIGKDSEEEWHLS